MKFIVFILTVLICGSVLPVSAGNSVSADTPSSPGMADQSALDNKIPADSDMDAMIHLLKESGLDISYGDEGETIFSMVEKSLHQIIVSLSSGNVEGFMDIPLIREILDYFGLKAGDIVISPDDTSGRMEAIDMYERKYESKSGV
ncbi:hypothetical protein [Methanospirillum hungatei]|uniref:hypothetical protein n=1 Tax=Methanospirillum hungatei TaxID=2203 RepID=UPI0026F0759D|nr:hypothetical protein [Methanospirillum hungatei]MCA1915865.1 hypothetical protein [Methanospirillum hungatei]